jgi:hypothetical protein
MDCLGAGDQRDERAVAQRPDAPSPAGRGDRPERSNAVVPAGVRMLPWRFGRGDVGEVRQGVPAEGRVSSSLR